MPALERAFRAGRKKLIPVQNGAAGGSGSGKNLNPGSGQQIELWISCGPMRAASGLPSKKGSKRGLSSGPPTNESLISR